MPIGAFVSNKTIWEQLFPEPWLHSTTFGGNPLACVAAIANIHVLLEEKLPNPPGKVANEMTAKLKSLRRRFPKLCIDVRGKGLMIGMEFPTDAIGYEVSKGLFDRGVLIAGTLFSAKPLRIEPPLTLTQAEMNNAVETIEKVFKEVNAKHFETKKLPVRK